MPKDEDILQLVSFHSSVNIASVLENALFFMFIQQQTMFKRCGIICSFNTPFKM